MLAPKLASNLMSVSPWWWTHNLHVVAVAVVVTSIFVMCQTLLIVLAAHYWFRPPTTCGREDEQVRNNATKLLETKLEFSTLILIKSDCDVLMAIIELSTLSSARFQLSYTTQLRFVVAANLLWCFTSLIFFSNFFLLVDFPRSFWSIVAW